MACTTCAADLSGLCGRNGIIIVTVRDAGLQQASRQK